MSNHSKSTNSSPKSATASSSDSNQQVVNLTLPITCQICLGKVKDPCVCSNLHAFCSFCIEIWLEKSNHCPTCRTIISQENPCRRILGGIENQNDNDKIKSNDFSHISMRKARFLSIFQQYEDEISRLSKYIELLNDEISNYKETCHKMAALKANNKCEIIPILKSKLQKTQNILDETLSSRENLKEETNRLKTENSVLTEEIMRLKINLTEKNSQISNRHTVNALEAKIESYEKEIKQLQIALDRSDKYISDLMEQQNRSKLIDEKKYSSALNDSKNSFCSNSSHKSKQVVENTHKIDSKIVKFSEKIDSIIPVPTTCSNSLFVSLSSQQLNSKPTAAYGLSSPNKMNDSYSARLKNKRINQSVDFEVPSPSQSLLTSEKSLNKTDENWYSPSKNKMKSKQDDFSLEKPSFNNEDETLNEKSLKYSMKVNEDDDNDEKSDEKFSNSSTLEFKDCLKLLNQAEKKVQSRIITTKNNNNSETFTLLTNTIVPNLGNSNTLSSSSFMSSTNLNGCSSLSMFGNNNNNYYSNSFLNKQTNKNETISDYKKMNSSSSNKLKKNTSMDQNLNNHQQKFNNKNCIYEL